MGPPVISYLRSHWFLTLPYPTHSFSGQTIIVTGSNTGMGLEAARHFVRLGAAKVVLAVRSLARGQVAAESITRSTGRRGVVEVWELDLASYASVKALAARAAVELERLDVVVSNAALSTTDFRQAEDNEETVTVNFVSTMLLGFLLLPKLRETSVKFNKEVVLTFVGSFVHWLTAFPERKAENILMELADQKNARMEDRYNVSKVLLLLACRELAAHVSQSTKSGNIVVSLVNPGSVAKSESHREHGGVAFRLARKALMRKTEEGSRTLLYAAQGGPDTHGQYLDDCKVAPYVSDFVRSTEGAETQRKVWDELVHKLEIIRPGIMQVTF
ncbi:putative short-chain dehydrogenase [Hyaloscypha variabilis F]|uniref:Putative short-chain dehydrogenase n=1 Tax=Hyaloscypha variabilis (strain UAMH 11265 / GT02V1 / F) TaxID=1149755 RepID=A0A2J6QV31_HYAVF|nr:putative short-chain dehydrogenase [Hyaloscypha variabilis F]